MDCIFCKIANNELSSYKIYEDELIIALLDVNPIFPGHTLIIPKVHTLDINTIDNDVLCHIIMCAKDIANLVVSSLGADGFTLIQNNGFVQEVKHFHLHIIPKYKRKNNMGIDEVYKRITNCK